MKTKRIINLLLKGRFEEIYEEFGIVTVEYTAEFNEFKANNPELAGDVSEKLCEYTHFACEKDLENHQPEMACALSELDPLYDREDY